MSHPAPSSDAYEQVAYGDLAFHLTHPGHLAAVATLIGLDPPPLATGRVLELGCGSGFNSLAMAQSAPGAQFTALDLSPNHIAHGREIAAATGTRNVDLICASIAGFDAPPASFDYIIAHGVYSWVPAPIRDAMLALIRKTLAPNGLAYLSYNTNPGWRTRGLIRDCLRTFCDPAHPSPEGLARARETIDHLTQSFVQPDSLYARIFQQDWDNIRDEPDYYVLHDYLAGENAPCLFDEFTAHAACHHLRYVADSRLPANSFSQGDDLQQSLDGNTLCQREQYLDWLVGRHFRQTILCHEARVPHDTPNLETLLRLNISLTAEVLDRQPDHYLVRRLEGAETEITGTVYLAVLEVLNSNGIQPIPAGEVRVAIREQFSADGSTGALELDLPSVFWNGWRTGLWAFRADAPSLTTEISPNPIACPIARYEAAKAPEATNRLHRPVALTAAEQQLLVRLDGSHPPSAQDIPALGRFAAQGLLCG